MTIAALILVGVVLVGGTLLLAALVAQRRADRVRNAAPEAAETRNAGELDEAEERLRLGLRSRLSHEMRTPLNSIITLSQLLIEDEKGALKPDQRRYLEVIRRSGRDLLAMVDQIAEGAEARPEGAAAAPESSAQPAPAANADGSTPSTPRDSASVLLIEDDAIERQRVGSFIEAAGYDVTRAASGEEGLRLLRSRHFGVVVLDLVMP